MFSFVCFVYFVVNRIQTSSSAPSGFAAFFVSGYALNSSPNFAMKLCVGHEHASPNAQIVRPAI